MTEQNQKCPAIYTTNSIVCNMYGPCPALLSYITSIAKYHTDKIWLNTVRVCSSNVVRLRAQNSCLTEALPGSSKRREVVGTANVIQHGRFQVAHFEKKEKRTVEAGRAVEDRHHCNLLDLACHSLCIPASFPNDMLKRFHTMRLSKHELEQVINDLNQKIRSL